MKTLRRSLRHAGPALGVAAALLGSPLAHAADVELHVQAPYELDSKLLVRFDLDRLHAQNATPIYADRFEIPYGVIEPLIASKLAEAVDGVRHFHITCKTILCPDTDIDVTIRSTFSFTQKNQPKIESIGPASDNTFRITLDTQVAVGIDVRVETETGIWVSASIPVGVQAVVGVHAGATLSLWPTLQAKDITVSLTQDGGNLSIGDGSVVTETALLLNEALASLGVSKGRSQIQAEINAAVAKLLAEASTKLTTLGTTLVTPKLQEADAIKDRLMTTTIPKVGRSLQQLMGDAGISIDVRSRTIGDGVRAVATTRFAPKPAGRTLEGTIRLPKTECKYGPPVGNDTIGYTRLPETVDTINADLAGKACSAVISGAGLRRVAYLGESPHHRLGTNDPANVLPNWTTMGTVTGKGSVIDKGGYYECAFAVSDLANASILELGIEPGSALAERMPIQGLEANLRARFLYATVAGAPLLLDAKGTPRNPTTITFGRANAGTLDQCPTSKSDGNGLRLPKGFDVALELDPETCPTCGKLDIHRHTNSRVRPGDVTRFTHGGVVIEEVLAPARAQTNEALAQIAKQRVGKAGLRPSRARGRAPKAAALPETHIRIAID